MCVPNSSTNSIIDIVMLKLFSVLAFVFLFFLSLKITGCQAVGERWSNITDLGLVGGGLPLVHTAYVQQFVVINKSSQPVTLLVPADLKQLSQLQ